MTTQERKLMRLPEQGQLAGVCAGLAEYFDLDVTLVRVVFIALGFATGGGMLLVYIVLAIIMPANTSKPNQDKSKSEISSNIEQLSNEFKSSEQSMRVRNYAGLGLIALGVWLLAVQFFPQWIDFRWEYIWPILLVVVGVGILSRNRR